ncbi:LuxR C-terminal-related transcriptional regulator [Cellulomonas sp. P5_C5]
MAADTDVPLTTSAPTESPTVVSRRTLVVRPLTDQVRAEVQSGRSVLVVGDAGVGKTHLVTAALAHLWIGTPTSPMPTVVSVSGAACPAGIPLGALEPLLGDVAISSLGSFARAVDALADSLRARSRGGPVILRVEDAHLLDRASSQALAWMVQQHEVQLVATARSSAVSQSPWLELWKDDVVERIDVPPFTLAEVQQWLVGEMGGQVSLDTVRRVWSETAGNVFHLGEVVGALEQQGGAWVWVGGATPGRRLLDVVAHDMSRLSGDARVALEIAALVCPVSLSVLLDLVSRPVVEELSRVGLISLSPRLTVAGEGDVTVDLAHALYAEAVRSGVPRARRREVLERVAGLANRGHRTGAALVRSVALALDCDLAVEPARLDAAVDAAFELQQPDTATRLLTSALRQTRPGELRHATLALQRADAWWHLDDAGRAARDLTDVFETLWATARPDAPTVGLMVAASALRARIAYHRDGDLDQALVPFDIAARWIFERGGEHAARGLQELESARLARLGYGGRPRLDDALAVLLDSSAGSAAIPLAAPTIVGLAQSGRFADAAHLSTRCAQLAGAHHDRYRWGRGEVAVAAFLSTLWSGDVPAAERVVDALDQEGNAAVDWVAVHVARGLIGVARGSWMQAQADLHAASARRGHADPGGVAVYNLAAEALAAAATGDAATARALLAEHADATARAMAGVDGEVQLLRADTLAWLRDPRAVDEARALAGWARDRGLLRVELEALHRSADRRRPGTRPRGVDPEVLRRVRELAPLVDGPRAAAIVRHVEAQHAGDDDLVRIAERELNRCGLWLPPVESNVSLTRREQEIASLAAGGLTSRAIASRLTLSVRTVDSHLARVFAKTGVHSREGLSAVLR